MTDALTRCSGCGNGVRLVLRLPGRELCAACWHAAGEPTLPAATTAQLHEAEVKTRARMIARGGNPAYVVHAGKA